MKWIFISLGIIVLGIGIALYSYYFIWMRMNSNLQERAEAAFSKGLTINDKRNDFVMMGTNKEDDQSTDTNNGSPYQVDYLDVKSGQFGVDEEYLYYKISFYGKFPKRAEKIGGDTLVNIGAKFHVMEADGTETAIAHFDFGWEPVINIAAMNTSYDFCPTGIEWPENARMACHGGDSKVTGGVGTDYIMGAMPLKKLGLKDGETLYLSLDEETKSSKYSHAAVDMLAGTGKNAAVVAWKVGTKDFKIDNNFNNKNE